MNDIELQTQTLFETEKEPISSSMNFSEWFSSSRFPWEKLGAELKTFLFDWINSIPKSERLQGAIHPTAVIEGDHVVIERGAIVEAGAFITGPTYIAAGAVVRHGAYVRGEVFADRESLIGHTTEVKGSILLKGAKAAHFAYVGNSVLGKESNLGAGTKLANLRFDHKTIGIRGPNGYLIDTGLKKLGAILGNRAQTGCNSVTNPGTVLTLGSYLRPTEVGTGLIKRTLPKF